jgi:hypothetical protein
MLAKFIEDLRKLNDAYGVGPIHFIGDNLTFSFLQEIPEVLDCLLGAGKDNRWRLTAIYANEPPPGFSFWDSAIDEVVGDMDAVIAALKSYKESLPYSFESPATQ